MSARYFWPVTGRPSVYTLHRIKYTTFANQLLTKSKITYKSNWIFSRGPFFHGGQSQHIHSILSTFYVCKKKKFVFLPDIIQPLICVLLLKYLCLARNKFKLVVTSDARLILLQLVAFRSCDDWTASIEF